MKSKILKPALFLGAAILSINVYARHSEKEGHFPPPFKGGCTPGKIFFEEIFDEQDTNKDGKISKDEHTNFFLEKFDKHDSDKNGFITKEEFKMELELIKKGKFKKHPEKGKEGCVKNKFQMMDLNGNGTIDKKEFLTKFSKMDTNGDKQVSLEELMNFKRTHCSPKK